MYLTWFYFIEISILDVAGGKSSVKLKASDIYSDDSGSDSEDKRSGRRSSSSSRSSSESDDEDGASKAVVGKLTLYDIVKYEYSS